MKKHHGILGFAVILLAAIFTFSGCPNPSGDDTGLTGTPPGGDPALSGNVTISPDSGVTTGTALTASYSGTETVTWQWNKDGTAIASATAATYMPNEAGSYTATASATGYQSKTSAAVAVTGDRIYAIGDTGPGTGKIFYVSEAGFGPSNAWRYLEAAPADISKSKAWASAGFTSTTISGTEDAIGTGKENTRLILATDTAAPAASACDQYSSNGKDDWFLPSKNELIALYTNRSVVGMENDNIYWSSSGGESDYPYSSIFTNGSETSDNKSSPCYVRAVRAF